MEPVTSIISSPVFTTVLYIIRAILIIVSLILLVGVIILIAKTTWLRYRFLEDYTEFFSSRPFGMKNKFQKLEGINKKLISGNEAEYKIAVIEAEDFLKEVFQKMGYKGELLDDILKQVDEKVLPSIQKVKDVQKIRDNIVHDPDYHLTKDQAKNIVKIYEKALGELEVF